MNAVNESLLRGFDALRQRDFRLLFSGQLVSQIGMRRSSSRLPGARST